MRSSSFRSSTLVPFEPVSTTIRIVPWEVDISTMGIPPTSSSGNFHSEPDAALAALPRPTARQTPGSVRSAITMSSPQTQRRRNRAGRVPGRQPARIPRFSRHCPKKGRGGNGIPNCREPDDILQRCRVRLNAQTLSKQNVLCKRHYVAGTRLFHIMIIRELSSKHIRGDRRAAGVFGQWLDRREWRRPPELPRTRN